MKVSNLKHEKYDVFIGRPSKWGNPFSVEEYGRSEAIKKYKDYILSTPELLYSLHELDGKILGCYCKPLPCHGDVLIQLRQEQITEEML